MQAASDLTVKKFAAILLAGIVCVFLALQFLAKKPSSPPKAATNHTQHQQAKEQFRIIRGSQFENVGGNSISDLSEMLDALYQGLVSPEQAQVCVFTSEAQRSARVDYMAKDYAICTADDESQPFAIEIDGSEAEILSGKPIRYTRHESFTTRNGMVRLLPVFKSVPGINTEEDYDASQYEAIKPN